MLGSLGEIVFEVSSNMVMTFDDFERSSSARLSFHELQGRKPLREFVGPDVETISFKIRLSTYEGVDPTQKIEKLRDAKDEGIAQLFVLDGAPQGKGYWLIENISESPRFFDNRGRPAVIECDITLKEYMETR